MTTLYLYRYRCTTDSKDVTDTGWYPSKRSVCPENDAHTIDSSLTVAVDSIKSNVYEIKEEKTATGGNPVFESKKMIIPATVGDYTVDYTDKHPLNLFSVSFTTDSSHKGDKFEVHISPDTTIGTVATTAVVATDIVINVSQAVIDSAMLGYYIKLDDGTNIDDLGEILNIDDENNQITVETAAVNGFEIGTSVKLTVKLVKHYWLETPMLHDLGKGSTGGMYVEANKIVRAIYTNNDGVAKTFVFYYSGKY